MYRDARVTYSGVCWPLLFLFLLLVAGNQATLQSLDHDGIYTESSESILERIRLVAPMNLIRNPEISAYNQTTISSNCSRDLAAYGTALVNMEMWALKMFDATSKIPSGILMGNIIDLGVYDECLKVQGEGTASDISGRHCMYSIDLSNITSNFNLKVVANPRLSICVPKSCDAKDMSIFFNNSIASVTEDEDDFGVQITSVVCSSINKKVWDTTFIVCFTVLIIYIGILVICTLCDLSQGGLKVSQRRHPVIMTLGQFSIVRSAKSILSTKVKEDNLPVLHGIRFLSICWVIIGHEYLMYSFGVNLNSLDLVNWWNDSWEPLYIFIAQFAVDTFFTMSGFLMAYLFLKQMKKVRHFNIFTYYMHRYIRLTPPLVALIVISIVYIPKLDSGPRWEESNSLFLDSCKISWWRILLYIQNIANDNNGCLGHLWYLAVDMQLFWISPFILYPLYRKPKVGLGILWMLLIASIAFSATLLAINKYPVMSFLHQNISVSGVVFTKVYEMTYHRVGPWIIGIALGFEVVNQNRRPTKVASIIGWFMTIAAFAYCTFCSHIFLKHSYVYDPIWETIFGATSRTIWGCGISWIIYASIHKIAGPISSFLSWKLFLPLSRISYCMYLVHMVIQSMYKNALTTSRYFSNLEAWRNGISDTVLTILVAFIFSILFESPVLVLEKMLFRRTRRESQYESQKELKFSSTETISEEK